MKIYGLIGRSLSHSFSQSYFMDKFKEAGLSNHAYINFELDTIDQFRQIIKKIPELSGLNVTIPYKEDIIPYLDELDTDAESIGAVNTIKIMDERTIGYNTDHIGFIEPLSDHIDEIKNALILGTGGASKAVIYTLNKHEIKTTTASTSNKGDLHYHDITDLSEFQLIVNCTPLGMYPDVDPKPDIPYDQITEQHILYDLVYNPSETSFLSCGVSKYAKILNGLEMLKIQAEASWKIWNA